MREPEDGMGSSASKETCSICLDTLQSPKVLPCKHGFHSTCINKWLETKTTCPLCRSPQRAAPSVVTSHITLHIDWDRTGDVWRRRVRVITPELVWSPADGPMPESLRSWRERHHMLE